MGLFSLYELGLLEDDGGIRCECCPFGAFVEFPHSSANPKSVMVQI